MNRPSTLVRPSMEESQQQQIQSLVKENHNKDLQIKKLREELAAEEARFNVALEQMKENWNIQRSEWEHDADRLHSCHLIEHRILEIALDEANITIHNLHNEIREGKAAVIHRDYKLLSFQIAESDRLLEFGDLEDQLDEKEAALDDLQKQLTRLNLRLNGKDEALGKSQQEYDDLQAELDKLRRAHATLQSGVDQKDKKLARIELQFESESRDKADIARERDELKRSKADLKRQLDKWQTMEMQGEEDVEKLRSERVKSDVKVQELTARLKEKEEELTEAKKKVSVTSKDAKERIKQWQDYAEDHEAVVKEKEEELEFVNQKLIDAEKLVQKLTNKVNKAKISSSGNNSDSEGEKNKTKQPKVAARRRKEKADGEDAVEASQSKPSDAIKPKAKAKEDTGPEKDKREMNKEPSGSGTGKGKRRAADDIRDSSGSKRSKRIESQEAAVEDSEDEVFASQNASQPKKKINLKGSTSSFNYAGNTDTNSRFNLNIPTDLPAVQQSTTTNRNLSRASSTQGFMSRISSNFNWRR